jgi:hypothetical protein
MLPSCFMMGKGHGWLMQINIVIEKNLAMMDY